MVKVIGPCFSLEARGTLNDVLTYAVLGRTCYAKTHFTPANPNTPGQIGIRCMAKFLTQVWKDISGAHQAQWQDYADQLSLSPYHAFLTINSRRWRGHSLPIERLDATGTPSELAISLTVTRTDRLHEIEVRIVDPNPNPWSTEVCLHKQSDFEPIRSTAKLILPLDYESSGSYYFNGSWIAPEEPPDPPYHYAKARYGIENGNASDWKTE